jgi:CheY-like chemotaxis protein
LGSRAIHFNKGGEVILKAEALKKQEQDTYKLYIQVADKSGVNHSPLANKNMNVGIKDNRFNMNNGLGLNIFLAQKLCENMGGEMLSDLDEDEIYHVFYGYIEIKSTDRRYLYENRQKNKRNCKRDYGKKILVVEDEITNAKIIEKVIISLGCTVRVTSNGEEALGMLASGEHNFDLILMDIHMPIMDGLVTTEHIRVGETIPIIALSANNTSKIKKLAEEKGMNGFLNKPVTKRLLVEELDKWFIQS